MHGGYRQRTGSVRREALNVAVGYLGGQHVDRRFGLSRKKRRISQNRVHQWNLAFKDGFHASISLEEFTQADPITHGARAMTLLRTCISLTLLAFVGAASAADPSANGDLPAAMRQARKTQRLVLMYAYDGT